VNTIRALRAGAMSTVLITASREWVVRHLSPLALARNLWQHRGLIGQFTRRDIEGRYRSSVLGFGWSFVTPLVLLLVYTFVFGVVFQMRWPGARTARLSEFGLVLFAGLTAFNVFSECVQRASGLIVSVPNYVKRVVFPLEVLPVSVLGSALFHAGVSLLVLLAAKLFLTGRLEPSLVWLPLAALPLVFLSLGLAWFLSSLGVFVRDLGYAVALIVQVLFFITPIFYPLELVPAAFRPAMQLNPLTPIVELFRRSIFGGTVQDPVALLAWIAGTAAVMLLGYAWFMKTKKAFADVV
jgi:lipopolysaccharide transport system permease protein